MLIFVNDVCVKNAIFVQGVLKMPFFIGWSNSFQFSRFFYRVQNIKSCIRGSRKWQFWYGVVSNAIFCKVGLKNTILLYRVGIKNAIFCVGALQNVIFCIGGVSEIGKGVLK